MNVTYYQVRRSNSSLQPHEQGQLVKEFASRKEANEWWEARSDRASLHMTTRTETVADVAEEVESEIAPDNDAECYVVIEYVEGETSDRYFSDRTDASAFVMNVQARGRDDIKDIYIRN